MPVQIGASAHNFSNPTGLLSDCHRRVETFMGALEAIAALCDQPLSSDARTSLDTALRYFREAAPKHTADEEESLFPVLRQIDNGDLREALAALQPLEDDHRWAEPLHQQVDAIGKEYLQIGSLPSAHAIEFKESVAKLAQMYRRHIEIEDRQVFPVAARVLTVEQRNKIAVEMEARRRAK